MGEFGLPGGVGRCRIDHSTLLFHAWHRALILSSCQFFACAFRRLRQPIHAGRSGGEYTNHVNALCYAAPWRWCRTALVPVPARHAGPDPEAVSSYVKVVVERYPELKADASFLDLQKNLVDTEQRIALARSYFNDIATFHNIRLEIIPDRFIAALLAMKPRPLISAKNFERAPVDVTLAT